MSYHFKKTIRPLCLSLRTPPIVRPQAILIGKMIPEWVAQGLEPVIITYESGGYWDIDVPVYKIPKFKINRILNRVSPISALKRSRYYDEMAERAVHIIKKHNLNLVFSFANPQHSNIIGSIIKKKTAIKFISHFSDPWYDNPCAFFSFWRRRRVFKQEKQIIKSSDKVIFINEDLKNMVMKKYPAGWQSKAAVIHHCFNPKDYFLDERFLSGREEKNKFIFSYVGVFYKQRNPEIVFQALRKIIDKDRNLAKKIKLQIIGCDIGYADFSIGNVKKLINKYRLTENVELLPRMAYLESLRYMQLSDCLLLLDVACPENYCLPSKLIDYAGSGSVILGIANSNSPVAQFLQKLGYKNFSYEEVDQLALYMSALVTGQINPKQNGEFISQFNVSCTTQKLIEIFNGVVSTDIKSS